MSEQTQVKSCCVSGHIHEGTPKGKFETLHGLNTYVTGSGAATIVFLPDIFGIYPNVQLLADTWAEEGGWRVVVPDPFEGDAVSLEHINTIIPNLPILDKRTPEQAQADGSKTMEILGPWLGKHSEAVVTPLINTFFKGVKAEGCVFQRGEGLTENSGKVGTVGFCWGGRYSFLVAGAEPLVDVAIAMHPSFLSEADVKAVTTPAAILWGDRDEILSAAQLDDFEKILRTDLGDAKVLIKRYKDTVHGFTVRGDLTDDRQRKTKEESNEEAIKFTKKAFAGSL